MKKLFQTVLLVCSLLSVSQVCHAEAWPTFSDYISSCALIVKAKTTVEKPGRYSFEFTETWKGKFDPAKFMWLSPANRYLASDNEHGVNNLVAGQEVVFFFTLSDVTEDGKMRRHSTAFPVNNGTLVYGSTSYRPQTYKVGEFKEAILSQAKQDESLQKLVDSLSWQQLRALKDYIAGREKQLTKAGTGK